MKILYGIENNYKNVTFDILVKCRIDNDIISIPATDEKRAELLGDPVPNVLKHISLVIDANESIQLYNSFIQQFYNNKKLKILNLVLYSNDEYYNQMYEITRNFYKDFCPDVETIYYRYSNQESFHNPYMENDVLNIFGYESRIPGILKKTIEALQYVKDKEFDYIIRSNISTIVNFKLLEQKLIDTMPNYASGQIINLKWQPENDHIGELLYYGLPFASGTSIIFSKNLLHQILENQKEIDYKTIDDVSIGALIQKKFPQIQPVHLGYFIEVEDVQNLPYKSTIFYRNKHNDRQMDIENIQYICKKLSNKNVYPITCVLNTNLIH